MSELTLDQKWMGRALELAERGIGLTSPNPAVGCVLLDQSGHVIGEGWHEYDLSDHAEIAALKIARERAADRIRCATAYVTLEPCNHTGRTGPCSQALVEAGVRRVVVATLDPNPLVAGQGVETLRKAGIETTVGVCEAEARRLNESFACWIQHRRPFVLMKVAMSLDGRIAPAPGIHHAKEPFWITNQQSREAVQLLRWQSDAVITGIDTVLADDPLMTDRSGHRRRRPLLRVVFDSALRMPLECKMVQTVEKDVVIFTVSKDQARADRLRELGVRVELLPSETGRVPVDKALEKLGSEGILSVMTETGSRLNTVLLSGGYVDRLHLFLSPQIMGTEAVPAFRDLPHALQLKPSEQVSYGSDISLCSLLHDPWTGL